MKLLLSRSGQDGYVFKTEDNTFRVEVLDYFIVNGYYHLIDKEAMTAPPLLVRKDCVKNMIKFKDHPEFTLERVEDHAGMSIFRVSSKNDSKEFHHVTYDKISNQVFCDFDCEGWQYNDRCYHSSAVFAYLGMGPGREPINVKKAFNKKPEDA